MSDKIYRKYGIKTEKLAWTLVIALTIALAAALTQLAA